MRGGGAQASGLLVMLYVIFILLGRPAVAQVPLPPSNEWTGALACGGMVSR